MDCKRLHAKAAVELANESNLRKEDMLLHPDVSGRIQNGYAELNTGTWWEETQRLTPGLKLLPLIFYLDDTHLS